MIRFYFKRGRGHVTSDKKTVPTVEWWTAINQVKCMNHKIRVADAERKKHDDIRAATHGGCSPVD